MINEEKELRIQRRKHKEKYKVKNQWYRVKVICPGCKKRHVQKLRYPCSAKYLNCDDYPNCFNSEVKHEIDEYHINFKLKD